jgi:hypothetical protein
VRFLAQNAFLQQLGALPLVFPESAQSAGPAASLADLLPKVEDLMEDEEEEDEEGGQGEGGRALEELAGAVVLAQGQDELAQVQAAPVMVS